MVGFRAFGRMGNFLFEAAAAIGYALKHGQEFSLPSRTDNPHWNPIYLRHLVHPDYIQGKEDVLINENGMQYQEIEWKDEWKDKQVILNGYWQSWKYTDPYRAEILYLFDFPYEKKEKYVAVHVRRGDYLRLTKKHPPVGKQWYENAMARFDNTFKFKFFSDDLAWCKQEFSYRSDCEFSTNTNEVADLMEASCCEHDIISSSTYGWWIAWLNRNPDKIVYLPENWFVPGWDNLDTKDVVPPYFTKI